MLALRELVQDCGDESQNELLRLSTGAGQSVSTKPVRCPHCKSAIIATSRPGRVGTIHRPAKSTQTVEDPDHEGVVLLICPACGGVAEWLNKRIVIVDAA